MGTCDAEDSSTEIMCNLQQNSQYTEKQYGGSVNSTFRFQFDSDM
jgi:hypothetical protein